MVQEGLRLAYGVSTRLQRVDPDHVIQYKDWAIPPGTSTGMTSIIVHQNADIFPKPLEFDPERWVEDPHLDRYLLSFSKG